MSEYAFMNRYLKYIYRMVTEHYGNYVMPCNVLGETELGNIKIEVFGRRGFKWCQKAWRIEQSKPHGSHRLIERSYDD